MFTSDTRHAHGPLPVPLMSSAASGPAVEYLVICGEDDGSRAISGLERSARAQHLDYHDKRERPWRPGSAIADHRKDCRSAPRTIHTDLQQNPIHRIGARALHESESGVMWNSPTWGRDHAAVYSPLCDILIPRPLESSSWQRWSTLGKLIQEEINRCRLPPEPITDVVPAGVGFTNIPHWPRHMGTLRLQNLWAK